MATDESWAPVARDTREALKHMGYPIEPRCLPDEAEPCGGTFALHVAAHLATLKAIADHQLNHLGPDFDATHAEIYMHVRDEMRHR